MTTIALARPESQPRQPRLRAGPGSASPSEGAEIGSRGVSDTLEGLAERHVDDNPRIAALRVQRRRDVDPDRSEAGAVACADAGAEAQIVEARQRRGRNVAGVDERNDAKVAECPHSCLEREFGEAAAADRIVEHRIARPERLKAVAAH